MHTRIPRRQTGSHLFYLHEKACVDAVVEQWPDRTIDVKEGSRHRLRVQSQTQNGWVAWKLKDGTEQLKQPKDAAPGDFSVLQVRMVGWSDGRMVRWSDGRIWAYGQVVGWLARALLTRGTAGTWHC